MTENLEQARDREWEIQEAVDAVMDALGEYRTTIWCEVLANVVIGVFSARADAEALQRKAGEQRTAL